MTYAFPSVFDFVGVIGDGKHDDGPALQTAINACAGGTLLWPRTPNGYRVTPQQDGIGLYIGVALRIVGLGAGINGVPRIVFDDQSCVGDAIVIEGTSARGTSIERLRIDSMHDFDGRHGIVVHAGSVQLTDVYSAVWGWGDVRDPSKPEPHFILHESGNVGANLLGQTRLPAGTYVNANFLEMYSLDVEYAGDERNGWGGAVYCHGSDSEAILWRPFFTHCGFAVIDATLEGMEWYGGHTEANFGTLRSSTATVLHGVKAEDIKPPDMFMGPQCVSYGKDNARARTHFGPLSHMIATQNTADVNGVPRLLKTWTGDALQGAFTAARNDEVVGTGVHHFVDPLVPGGPRANAERHEAEIWGLGFTTTPGPSGLRGMGVGIAITGPQHVVGAGLPHVTRPWINSAKEWRKRQASVAIAPGTNVVRLWESWYASSGLAASDSNILATQDAPGSDTIVTVQIELHHASTSPLTNNGPNNVAQENARAAELAAVSLRIGPTTVLYQDAGGGNFAVRIDNDSQTPVTVDLLWHFVQYVPSAAGGGSP